MSYDRAIRLLQETDEINISNGCALIINAAAQPGNIPGLCATNVIQLIGRIIDSFNGDPLLKACWAISNLTVHDQSREAVYVAGIVPKLARGLRSGDTEIITKTCWAITNLARHPQAQAEIVNSGLLSTLTDLLKNSSEDIKSIALQPICNIVVHDEYQLLFRRNQGLHPVINLMSSQNERTKELAVTLISFITTTHDSIREDIVNMGGLRPLCVILTDNGAAPRLKELALNSLINLSIAESNENTIVEQGVIPSVIQLMTDDNEALKCNSAMLLSNLFTNEQARIRVRNLNWCSPVLNNIRSGSLQLVTQLVRVIINITFDEYCRHQLVKAGAETILDQADVRLKNGQLSGLVTSALKNLSVPVSDSTMQAVGDAPAPSTERYVEPSVTVNISNTVSNVSTPPAGTNKPANVNTPPPAKHDDIDDILGEISSLGSTTKVEKKTTTPPQKQTPPPKSNASDALDDILDDIASLTNDKKNAPPPKKETPPPTTVTTTTKTSSNNSNDLTDIDDILADLGNPVPKKVSVTASVESSGSRNRPVTQRVSQAFRDDFNDIDALLSGISDDDLLTFNEPTTTTVDFGDIDDLLNDLGGSKPTKQPAPAKSTTNFDDIDDILADLSSGPSAKNESPKTTSKSDMDAIDDLLAELTF
eukprot:TRINITY_DN2967_c0_g1_i1.p1 TRINITY_DN2967_c0_g1~~TRINITY_DN2967_c0_g1_i1.p1  ORF type:complete len:679 (-),score=165.79 TRINITY_DN2967_c0_g1_i1:90-2039(-)